MPGFFDDLTAVVVSNPPPTADLAALQNLYALGYHFYIKEKTDQSKLSPSLSFRIGQANATYSSLSSDLQQALQIGVQEGQTIVNAASINELSRISPESVLFNCMCGKQLND